jgi:hypothetical protein
MSNGTEFIRSLPPSALLSYINVINAYHDLVENGIESLEDIGYNNISGFVFLQLGDNISIVSQYGGAVRYIVIDDSGNETFHDTFDEATQQRLMNEAEDDSDSDSDEDEWTEEQIDEMAKNMTIYEDKTTNICSVCLDKEKEYVCVPCGHYHLCYNCGEKIDDCPICRAKVVACVKH